MSKYEVSIEQARKLKNLGFNEPTFTVLSDKGDHVNIPLYEQAFDWLYSQLNSKGAMPCNDKDRKKLVLDNLIRKVEQSRNPVINTELKTVNLPHNSSEELIQDWKKRGYHVQLEIV